MISESWRTIEAKLNATPGSSEAFGTGASVQEIAAAAEALEVRFPPDFIESYEIHNGQAQGIEFIFGPYRLWTLSEIVANHRAMLDSGYDRGKELIGFADNGGSSTVAIQTANGEDRGSIIELFEDGEERLGGSFGEFLAGLARRIDLGELVWDEAAGGFSTVQDIADSQPFRERLEAWEVAQAGPSRESIGALPPGTETDILGARTGRTRGTRCQLATATGTVQLDGSLRGATFNQPIRVRVRVGKRRLLGLLPPVHEILSWKPIE